MVSERGFGSLRGAGLLCGFDDAVVEPGGWGPPLGVDAGWFRGAGAPGLRVQRQLHPEERS